MRMRRAYLFLCPLPALAMAMVIGVSNEGMNRL